MNLEIIFKGLILGGAFGLTLYLIGAANRRNLLEMLKLRDLTLMKIILFGIGVAAILIHLSLILGIMPLGHFSIKTMYPGVIIGSAVLAAGFGMIGLCPGTSIASLGSGYFKAIIVIIGGLFGAWCFSLSYGSLKSLGLFKEVLGGKTTLFFISDKYHALFDIGPIGGVFMGIGFMILALMIPEKLSE